MFTSRRSRTEPLDLLPVLSRGRHRTPRSGGCFMEFASYLAGESWSDHPQCTHSLLAELARGVNDRTSDAARPALAPLIPEVIGIDTDDIALDVRVALRSARAALPVASAARQTVMAVSILTAERVLAEAEGRPGGHEHISVQSRAALAEVPHADRAARGIAGRAGISVSGFRKHSAPHTVRTAVLAIAEACAPDSDARLRRLLADAIKDCAPWRAEQPAPAAPQPMRVPELS